MIFNTDSYKLRHFAAYRPNTTQIYSYGESRGGPYKEIFVMGMQAVVAKIFENLPTLKKIQQYYYPRSVMHGTPLNLEGWEKLFYKYGVWVPAYEGSTDGDFHLTKLPIVIEGVRDGYLAKPGEPLFAVYNTDPEFPWLTSYIETALIRVWYPITVATRVYHMKQKLRPYFAQTTESGKVSGFGILDFGSRGATSEESSALGGLGHLAHFIGSDNLPAVEAAWKYYNEEMAAYSVDATEHSIMTQWSLGEQEISIEHLINNVARPNSILSVVGDSYNYRKFVEQVVEYEEQIRNKGVTFVIRPDSGDMREVLGWTFDFLNQEVAVKFNSKDYLEYNNFKVLQGDGIDEDSVDVPFSIAKSRGVSSDMIMTGSGGGILQKDIDRDTLKFAFKASYTEVDGVGYGIGKAPMGDPTKRSKKGKFFFPHTYYNNGVMPQSISLSQIRAA